MPTSLSLPTDRSDSTSTNLLRRVVDGDQDAWKRFVELYSALIYAKCRSRDLTPEDSADVVQEVFRRVHRAIAEFRRDKPEQGFRRWLRTIARNVIIDHFRSQTDQPKLFGGDTMAAWIGVSENVFDDDSDFSMSDTSMSLMMRTALESIRVDYEDSTWQAFWRTAVEGQAANVVAIDLDITHGSVRQAKYKILRRLRQEFEDLL